MPAQSSLMMNPMLGSLSPSDQQSLVQLQQRQAIGQAMLQEGMQPMDTSNAQVGGLAYHVSPLQGLAKMLQTYLGNKMSMDSLGQQAQLMGKMYGNAFGQDQQVPTAQSAPPVAAGADSGGLTGPTAGMGGAQGTPSPQDLGAMLQQNGVATPTQTVSTPGTFSLPGHTAAESKQLYMMNPEEYAKARMGFVTPTDATRMALAAHLDPVAANAAAQFKANYLTPNQGTPGTIARSPYDNKPMYYSPNVPANGQPAFNAGGQVIGMAGMPGSNELATQASAATAAGEGSQLPFTSGVDAQGNPLPVMSRTQAATGNAPLPMRNNNPGAVSPGGTVAKYPDMQTGLAAMDQNLAGYASDPKVKTLGDAITKWVGSPPNAPAYIADVTARLGIKANTPVDLTNPAQRLALSTAIMLHENGSKGVFNGGQQGAPAQGNGAVYAAPPLAAQANATTNASNLQNEMSDKWKGLNAANQQAQSTVSYLQNIKTLAPAASTGPQADRINYANGLLSLAGSEKATDAVTATDLLNKYSNQITARLSAGGMGTDSARTILQSAYPNAHMTPQAISEAADNLIGAQQMTQAKAKLLAPLRNSGDAQGYTNTEMQFDQNADPRIFQYANIQDPVARAAFAKNLMQQDPKIVNKIQSLQKLGALQ